MAVEIAIRTFRLAKRPVDVNGKTGLAGHGVLPSPFFFAASGTPSPCPSPARGGGTLPSASIPAFGEPAVAIAKLLPGGSETSTDCSIGFLDKWLSAAAFPLPSRERDRV